MSDWEMREFPCDVSQMSKLWVVRPIPLLQGEQDLPTFVLVHRRGNLILGKVDENLSISGLTLQEAKKCEEKGWEVV